MAQNVFLCISNTFSIYWTGPSWGIKSPAKLLRFGEGVYALVVDMLKHKKEL